MNLEKYIAKALENIKECINCINFYFPEIFAKIEETREKFSGFEGQEIETCTKNELNDNFLMMTNIFEQTKRNYLKLMENFENRIKNIQNSCNENFFGFDDEKNNESEEENLQI